MRMGKRIDRSLYWLFFLLLVMSVLIFANIDNSLLWKDEAITANIGYNTLKYGYPTIWDGKNLISSTDGNSFNQLLLSSNYEWLQFYISAGSFAILGKTTFAARVPYAIFALLSVVVVWFIAQIIFRSLKKTICCTILYGFNVQFLLYSYQSRYYSLVLFGTATIILTVLIMENKYKENQLKLRHYVSLALASVFIFHSNRIAGFSVNIAIALFFLYTHKRKALKFIFPLVVGFVTWGIWYLVNCIILQAPNFGLETYETHLFTKILLIMWKIQVYLFPFISLTIIYLLLELFHRGAKKRVPILEKNSVLFVFVSLINIIVVAIPHWGIVNHYFIPILVAAPFLETYFIIDFFSKSKYLTIGIVMLLLLSNVLNILPYYGLDVNSVNEKNEMNNLLSDFSSVTTNYGIIASPDTDGNFRTKSLTEYLNQIEFKSLLGDYLLETVQGNKSYLDEVVNILNDNAEPDDTVLVLGFEYEPIVFYTELRVVNNMTSRLKPWADYFSEYPNQEKFEILTRINDNDIDWIIYKSDGTEQLMFEDENYLKNNLEMFEVYRTGYADTVLSNSPDLDYHMFENVVSTDEVLVYRRINGK